VRRLGRCVLTIRLVTPKRPTAAHDKLSTVPETRDPYQTSHTSLRVQCYAGRKADERPVRFQLGDDHHVVDEVVDQWYGLDATFHKVRADDGNLYILKHETTTDEWTLESFRRLQWKRLTPGQSVFESAVAVEDDQWGGIPSLHGK